MGLRRPKSIVRMDDAGVSLKTINMLLYGHPGEGKTPLWGTAERLLLMDSDHGFESAAASGSSGEVMPVTSYEELDEAYRWLHAGGYKEFDWVVWDSLTLFQERALIDEIMVDAVAENPNQDEFVPSQRQYLINMNKVCRYVRNFVDLDVNFGISCHVLAARDPEGASIYMPFVQGKNMPSRVSGYMNVIGYLGTHRVEEGGTKKAVKRVLFRQGGSKFYARDRFMALGNYMDQPSVPKITALIEQKKQQLGNGSAAPSPTRRVIRRPSATKEQ